MLIKKFGQNSRLTNGLQGKVIGFRSVKTESSEANLLPGVVLVNILLYNLRMVFIK